MATQNRFKPQLMNPWVFVLAAVVIAVGVVLFISDREDANDTPAPERQAVPVEVAPVEAMTLEETVRGVGTLRAAAMVDIRPEVAGRIRAIPFEEGGVVEEGQVLFEIDDEKLRRQLSARQAALQAAEVQVENAQRTFDRLQQLRGRGVVSQDELDQAQADLDSALADRQRLEAEAEVIEEELRDTRVSAPFSGAISERRVDRGDYVSVGDSLATLYQTDPLEIAFNIPERHIGRVRRGQTVQVTVAAYPGRPFEGTVNFVSPAVDEATRNFLVKAAVPSPEGQLKPGIFATAVVTVGVREAQPVVPEEALVATRRGYMVFVVEDDVVRAQEVQTGLREQGVVEVLQGLEVGQQVVRAGHLRLSGGERVNVVERAPSGPVATAEAGAGT